MRTAPLPRASTADVPPWTAQSLSATDALPDAEIVAAALESVHVVIVTRQFPLAWIAGDVVAVIATPESVISSRPLHRIGSAAVKVGAGGGGGADSATGGGGGASTTGSADCAGGGGGGGVEDDDVPPLDEPPLDTMDDAVTDALPLALAAHPANTNIDAERTKFEIDRMEAPSCAARATYIARRRRTLESTLEVSMMKELRVRRGCAVRSRRRGPRPRGR